LTSGWLVAVSWARLSHAASMVLWRFWVMRCFALR